MTQAELIDIFTGSGRTDEARQAAAQVVQDCERQARMLRDAFTAMDQIEAWEDGFCRLDDAVAKAHDVFGGQGELKVCGGANVLPWSIEMATVFFAHCFDNAFRHGARVVDIEAVDNGGLRLVIRDDGSGLGGVSREHALRPFVSSTPATHTGLGLWVAQAWARRAGGAFSLPAVTRGFVVECRFPVKST